MTIEAPSRATFFVPDWLWGGAPQRLFDKAGLRVRKTDTTGVWTVQTEERYERRRSTLVTHEYVAGPGASRRRGEVLAQTLDDLEPDTLDARVEAGIEKRRQRLAESANPVHLMSYLALVTMTARTGDLLKTVDDAVDALREIRMESSSERAFPDARAYLVRRSPELLRRAKLASLWVRLTYDESLRAGDLAAVTAAQATGDNVFASGAGLHDGVYLFDAYLGPLLGAMAPTVWAFAAHRTTGVLLFTLGRGVAGTTGDPSEMLHLLPSQGGNESVPVEHLDADAPGAASAWWCQSLNKMFEVLTDPAVFTDRDATYLPMKHLQGLLTVEQLFRRVGSIQTTHRDSNARRVLLFSVLDTVERLTRHDIELMCSLDFATTALEDVRDNMPPAAAQVLLPAAERGVRALRRLQDGFFLRRQAGRDVTFTNERGDVTTLPPDVAAASYIRVLRDATHGHGSNKAHRVNRTNALLAHHDGAVPHDLALLGYLYLLRLLTRPDVLRQTLYRRGYA